MISWIDEYIIKINDTTFILDLQSSDGVNTDANTYVLRKPKSKVLNYLEFLSKDFSPNSVFELGMGSGTGIIFLDKLFEPGRIVGLDIDDMKPKQLVDYALKTGKNIGIYNKVKQTDIRKLAQIFEQEFLEKPIDLIIDDASHWYNPTLMSFKFLYPKLSVGGKYVIESWAWSFKPAHQKASHPWYEKTSLVTFIFDLLQEMSLENTIKSIEITKELLIITKSDHKTGNKIFKKESLRGRSRPIL